MRLQVYEQTGLFFYRFRFLLAGITAITFLILVSVLVTVLGSDTVLAHPSAGTTQADTPDTPNVATAIVSGLAADTQKTMLSAGAALYRTCRSITAATAQSGGSIVHGSAAAADSTWHGAAFAVRGIGSGVIFTVRIPGKIVGSIDNGGKHTVSDLIKAPDPKPAPVISAETSSAILARLSVAEQPEIAKLQAAQLAANQALDGTIVAGDPGHGGYPAKWDNRPQDSTLDSWGMYNRECVSYAAWKVYQTYGYMPYWGGVGNANEWVRDAVRAGIPTSATPQMHTVAISMRGYYGHAMWVEAVQGSRVYVSQYNYDLHGHYSEMWVNGSSFTYIYFK